jgi:hypothetical protein
MITAAINYDQHLQQQLVVEQWFQGRTLPSIDLCDFTDHVYTDDRLVTDYAELDTLYERWYYLMYKDEYQPVDWS